jgi:flotillin
MSFPLFAVLSTGQMIAIALLVFVVMFLFGMVVLLSKQYKRCPPNRAMVIYGRTGPGQSSTRVLHGGAAFVVPLLQDFGYLSLEPIQVEVPGLPGSDVTGFNFELPSLVTVAIGTNEESLHAAAARLLGLSLDAIRQQVQPIVHTEIMSLAETVRGSGKGTDQLSFANQLRSPLEKKLDSFGLQLVNIGQMMPVRRDQDCR